MKLIGAGFGRTGTLSLKRALEELGFGPCYHMQEVFQHREHAKLWHDAARGRPVDWRALFRDYEATVDFPAHPFYRELMDVYPDAKVLLSVREPESWYESTLETIYRAPKVFPRWLRPFVPWMGHILSASEKLIWQDLFSGRFEDKAYALKTFERYNEEVKRTVPEDRLLVFDVKEGWAPLCAFLGVAVPERPFPHVNDRAQMQRMIRRVGLARWLLPSLAASLAAGLYLVFRRRRPS